MRADELELELIVHEGNPMREGDGMCEHVCQSDDYKKKDPISTSRGRVVGVCQIAE